MVEGDVYDSTYTGWTTEYNNYSFVTRNGYYDEIILDSPDDEDIIVEDDNDEE